MNLLAIALLYFGSHADNPVGTVKDFQGCAISVTSLVGGGGDWRVEVSRDEQRAIFMVSETITPESAGGKPVPGGKSLHGWRIEEMSR